MDKPLPKRSPFGRVLDVVVLLSAVCGNGPVSFRLAAVLAFGSSYLIRGLGDYDLPRPIVTGVLILVGYYCLVGVYRLFVYNRFLDPLLGIPGPKGHWMRGVHDTIVASEVIPYTSAYECDLALM